MRLSLLVLLASCVESSAVVCSDGRICPVSTRCDVANHQCVTAEQLRTCVGMADQTDCFVEGTNVWAVGENGTISHCSNGVWTASTVTTADLTSVWGSGPDDIYAAARTRRAD